MLDYWKLAMLNLNIQFEFPSDPNFIFAITLVHMRSLWLSIDFSLTSVPDRLAPPTQILLTLFRDAVYKELKMHYEGYNSVNRYCLLKLFSSIPKKKKKGSGQRTFWFRCG